MVSLACLAILLQPQIFSGDHVLGLGISQKGTFLEARGKYWKQALEGFLSSPIIGTGSGSFYLQSIKHQEGLYSTSWYAHNYPLQIIAELGVLGGTLLLLLCFEIWKKARAAALLKPENKILAESIILSFLLSIVSINLDYLIIWMLTWASIGVLVGQSRQPEQVTKAHNPKFVYGFGLVILVIAYMFLIGAEIYQFSLAKGTIVLMPFNTGKTLSYLDTKIGQISYTQANTILLFNKEHPEILAALGKAFENRDERYSAELYKRAIKNSPKNKEYLTSLLTQLSKNPALIPIINPFEIRDSFYNASFQESHVAHPMPPLKEIQNTYLYRDTFNEALSSSLQRDKSPVFSKLYYLWGLNLFGKDNRVSILLLNKAIVLEPEWSYFYLELASLYLNVGDSLQAQKILNACLQQKFAGDHCASYTTDTLPPFGTYKKNIIEEL